MSVVALYPGSFDPLTNGHVSIIERGLRIFDEIVVGIAVNIQKQPLFTLEERVAMIEAAFPNESRLKIESFQGLLVDYARQRGCKVVLRGLRAVSDFEYELQMANMNRKLDAGIETMFMMTEESNFYVSSRLVKEVAAFGGRVTGLVPDHVEAALIKRFTHT